MTELEDLLEDLNAAKDKLESHLKGSREDEHNMALVMALDGLDDVISHVEDMIDADA